MKTALILLTFLMPVLVYTQNLNAGISFNPGISKLAWNGKSGPDTKWVFSGNVGMFLEKGIGGKSILGIELLYAVFESKETRNDKLYTFDPMTFEIIILGSSTDVSHTHLTYAALPVYIKYRFKKIQLKLGWQTMYLSKSTFDSQNKFTYNGVTNTSNSNGEIKSLNKLDYGPKAGFQYNLSERAILSLEYYHGVKRLGDAKAPFERLNRQATLGLQYSLTTTNSISEK